MSKFSARAGDIVFGETDAQGVDWVLSSVDGWGTTATTFERTQKPRQSGSWSGDTFSTGRNVALNGSLSAPTPDAADNAFDRLASAFPRDEFVLFVTAGGAERWIPAKRSGEITPIWLNDRNISFSVQVASDDWRKFGTEMSGSTLLPMTSGGLTIPFTVPFTINSTVVSGQVSLTNPGNESGPVRLRIDGPVTGPVVTHVGSGRQLVFASSLVLGAGEWIDVDMEAHTVLANGQASRSGWVTSRGWSSFEPGQNTWSFTATAYDPASKLTIMTDPAWQ